MPRSAKKSVFWLILVTIAAFSGCTAKPAMQRAAKPADTAEALYRQAPTTNTGAVALDVAHSMLGMPYRYGGTDPGGFDCSGLVYYSFKQAGVVLPRTSQEIFRSSQLINPEDMRPGDLVFFRVSAKKISHVGIYAGNNTFIHSPSSGKGVSYANLNSRYWKKRLIGAGRF